MEQKRTESELIALYTLEPGIKDVYVEGPTDMEFLTWFLTSHGIDDVNVYVADTVDVPKELIHAYGLNTGSNRSRLLALSAKLADSVSHDARIVCIVDRDNEDYLPTGVTSPFLRFTDYNSIELYSFNVSSLRKFVALVLGGFALSPSRIIEQCTRVLEEVYLIRLSSQALGWGMEWLDFTKYVTVGGCLEFSRETFLKAYLLKNRKWSRRSDFEGKIREFRPALLRDPRHRMRGHDLMDLLHHMVRKLKPKRRFGDAQTFQGAITGCIEAQQLAKECLFRSLLTL